MTKAEIEKLATATAQWWTLKRLIGIEPVLGEGELIIPVAEHLIAQGWGDLEFEQNSRHFFGDNVEAYYDLNARKDGTTLLIELKYSKEGRTQRLIQDLIKLALPPADSKFSSLLLILDSSMDSTSAGLLSKIVSSGKVTFSLRFTDNEHGVEVIEGTKPPIKLTGESLAPVLKWMKGDRELRELTAQCDALETIGDSRVAILSVRRQVSVRAV